MKLIIKILLVTISVPAILLCVLAVNLRFQMMTSSFWIKSFEKGDTYLEISNLLNGRLYEKVEASGGKGNDVADLSTIISPASLKEFIDANIKSALSFANGRSREIIVHVPFSNIPSFSNLPNEMSLSTFLERLNINVVNQSDIAAFSRFGLLSWLFLIISLLLLTAIFALFYLLNSPGKRLALMGTVLILSGILLLSGYFAGSFIGKAIPTYFSDSANVAVLMGSVITPPIIESIVGIWIYFGLSALVLGILLFFVKKPVKNISIPR